MLGGAREEESMVAYGLEQEDGGRKDEDGVDEGRQGMSAAVEECGSEGE